MCCTLTSSPRQAAVPALAARMTRRRRWPTSVRLGRYLARPIRTTIAWRPTTRRLPRSCAFGCGPRASRWYSRQAFRPRGVSGKVDAAGRPGRRRGVPTTVAADTDMRCQRCRILGPNCHTDLGRYRLGHKASRFADVGTERCAANPGQTSWECDRDDRQLQSCEWEWFQGTTGRAGLRFNSYAGVDMTDLTLGQLTVRAAAGADRGRTVAELSADVNQSWEATRGVARVLCEQGLLAPSGELPRRYRTTDRGRVVLSSPSTRRWLNSE